MIKIGICDDNYKQIEIIKDSLYSFEKENDENFNSPFEISSFDNSFLLTSELDKGVKFDILLLDICMPGMLGTDVAKTVRKNKDITEIIFITTSDEFAVDAFALKAAHYLLKPFSREEFNEAIIRAIAKISTKKTINIKTKDSFREICIDEILFIESFSHVLSIHLSTETLEIRDSLTSVLAQLNAAAVGQFISPCKGYIVNLKSVKMLSRDCFKLSGGQTIPLAGRSFAKIKEMYFNYKFGESL